MNQSPHSFRSTSGARQQSVAYDEGLRQFFLKVYNYMGLGLVLSGVCAYLFYSVPALSELAFTSGFRFAVMLATFGLIFMIHRQANTLNVGRAQAFFWLFCALQGSLLSVFFVAFQSDSIIRAFFVTASVFGLTSLWGYVTKSNLMGWGNVLFMLLTGFFVTMLVNLFLQSSTLHYVMCFVGVGLFTALTAYDTQRLKLIYAQIAEQQSDQKTAITDGVAVIGALSLYLNFINIFIFLLQLMGNRD